MNEDHDDNDLLDDRLRSYGRRWRSTQAESGPMRLFLSKSEDPTIHRSARKATPWLLAACVAVLVAGVSIPLLLKRAPGPSETAAPAAVSASRAPATVEQNSAKGAVKALCPPPATVGVPWDGTSRSEVPPPSVSFDRQHLVPQQRPTAAVICVYKFSHVILQVSHTSAEVSGDLSGIGDLAQVPLYDSGQACAAVIPDHTTNYRLGLTYPSGQLWISTYEKECASSSNGTSIGYAAIYPVLAEVARTGTWPQDIEPLLKKVRLGTVDVGSR